MKECYIFDVSYYEIMMIMNNDECVTVGIRMDPVDGL
jgi:hypothetical protein